MRAARWGRYHYRSRDERLHVAATLARRSLATGWPARGAALRLGAVARGVRLVGLEPPSGRRGRVMQRDQRAFAQRELELRDLGAECGPRRRRVDVEHVARRAVRHPPEQPVDRTVGARERDEGPPHVVTPAVHSLAPCWLLGLSGADRSESRGPAIGQALVPDCPVLTGRSRK